MYALVQARYEFRFRAPAGTRVHSISRSDVLMSLVRENSGLPDTLTFEGERIESLTQRIDAFVDGHFLALLVYDSVGVRKRPDGGVWRDLAATERELATARVVLTDRLEALGAEFIDVPHLNASVAEVMRGAGAGIHCEFPESPTPVGDSWNVNLAYALTHLSALARDESVPLPRELRSHAAATLDSVITGSRDTLAYISVKGRLEAESTDRIVAVSGDFASSLIWSVGWQAYASAATRAVVTVQYDNDDNGRTSASTAHFDILTQTEVRT